jgi:hypothetical protein
MQTIINSIKFTKTCRLEDIYEWRFDLEKVETKD